MVRGFPAADQPESEAINMKGRLKQLIGTLLVLMLCVSLAAPAAAATPGTKEIAAAALDLISSPEGSYGSVSANDSGAVSVGRIQWHGQRALIVVRLAVQYMGAAGAVSILGQSFYNEITNAGTNWSSRSVNSTEKAALSKLLDSDAGHRAQDDQGVADMTGYISSGQKNGLTRPEVLVYYCDMYNHWPVEAINVAKSAVSSVGSGNAVTLDVIHNAAKNSGFSKYMTLRNKAYDFCSNINWSKYMATEPTPTPTPTSFSDVPAGSWYAESVKWAVDKGITSGTGNNCFSPDNTCTRAEAVTFLWRAMGSLKTSTTVTVFDDVSTDAFYFNAVYWAREQGITSGTGDKTFSPNDKCTRGQIITFLWRAANCPAGGGKTFSDVPADSFYATAVSWAASNGITSGTTATTFAPDDYCTRAQIVTFLYRARNILGL